MGNRRKGVVGRLLGRWRHGEEDIVINDDGFERLFGLEPEDAGPAEQAGADLESMWAALLGAGECLQALAGTMQETNRRMAEILGGLERELAEYCGRSAAEREEGLKGGGNGNTGG